MRAGRPSLSPTPSVLHAYLPIPFPADPGGGPQCAPAVVGANARLTVGAGTATAAAYPGQLLEISVS